MYSTLEARVFKCRGVRNDSSNSVFHSFIAVRARTDLNRSLNPNPCPKQERALKASGPVFRGEGVESQ